VLLQKEGKGDVDKQHELALYLRSWLGAHSTLQTINLLL
jgi:hypothetical protein